MIDENDDRLGAALRFAKGRRVYMKECAICGKVAEWGKRGLHRDHDHKTGKTRGYLCHNCNVGLGHFKDSPKLLQKAIEYLELCDD
jgi:hypothetical protein